jgi:hypothetical protein
VIKARLQAATHFFSVGDFQIGLAGDVLYVKYRDRQDNNNLEERF